MKATGKRRKSGAQRREGGGQTARRQPHRSNPWPGCASEACRARAAFRGEQRTVAAADCTAGRGDRHTAGRAAAQGGGRPRGKYAVASKPMTDAKIAPRSGGGTGSSSLLKGSSWPRLTIVRYARGWPRGRFESAGLCRRGPPGQPSARPLPAARSAAPRKPLVLRALARRTPTAASAAVPRATNSTCGRPPPGNRCIKLPSTCAQSCIVTSPGCGGSKTTVKPLPTATVVSTWRNA